MKHSSLAPKVLILLRIPETEYPIWAAAHLLRIVFILPIVFPKTNRAQFKVAPAK